MFMPYLNSINEESDSGKSRIADDVYDERMFKESIRVDLNLAKKLFTSLLKQKHNRKVSGLTVYYLGIVYQEMREYDTARSYFNHLILNYQEQVDLVARARKKLAYL